MGGITEFKPSDIASIEKDILHNDYDFVGVLSGGEGFGKSTLAKKINKKANIKSVGSYKLERDTLFFPTMEEVDKIYIEDNRHQSKQWDEAIRLLYKLDWASKSSKAIVKDFAVNRQLNMGTWLCIPRMKDLNENFRNWRVDWWGFILERGICLWWSKDWSPFASDLWHWDENERRIRKYQRKGHNSTSQIINILSKTIGFQGITYFDAFPDDDAEWIEYKRLKSEKKVGLLEGIEKRDDRIDRAKTMLDDGLPYEKVGKYIGVHKSTIYDWFPVSSSCKRSSNKDKEVLTKSSNNMLDSREIRKSDSKEGENSEELPN